jgi:hypothetical protein
MNKKTIIMIVSLIIVSTYSQVSACTGFTASDENFVLVGSNEDWHDYNFNIRFFPAEDGKHGMMFFEIAVLQQDGTIGMGAFAGMSDQGCWYDSYATPYLLPVNSSDKPLFSNSDCYYKDNFPEYCLSMFSTIEEVRIEGLKYNAAPLAYQQFLVVDATGNSVIIEGDEWIFKEGNFQVVSNFYQSHPELGGLGNAFERYNIAVSMLEDMTDLSVEHFTNICNATHQEAYYPSVYSWICDLKNQIIYLYYFYDYENVVFIDLKEELKEGEHFYFVGSLFEPKDNNEPDKPESPFGYESGIIVKDYKFNCRKISDPDGDKVSYLFDWDDGTYSVWIPDHLSDELISSYHSWSEEGVYNVRVKARDIYGAESEWSDPIAISIAKNKPCMKQYFFNFLELHPNLFPILRQLLKPWSKNCVMEVDPGGNPELSGSPQGDGQGRSIQKTSDGIYIVSGYTDNFANFGDGVLFKIDSEGNIP